MHRLAQVSSISAFQAPALGLDFNDLPGSLGGETSSNFIPRYLEGQSAITIKQVSCGHLFTACLTGKATQNKLYVLPQLAHTLCPKIQKKHTFFPLHFI